MRKKDHVIIVTGDSQGIGAGCVRLFLESVATA
jgi:NAD(P)-dependent dehydrogenase (short-subunit alcohol dehydrogenase family)